MVFRQNKILEVLDCSKNEGVLLVEKHDFLGFFVNIKPNIVQFVTKNNFYYQDYLLKRRHSECSNIGDTNMRTMIIAAMIASVALSGCTNNPYTTKQASKAAWGAGIGVLTGAALVQQQAITKKIVVSVL
jgi:hypothetical protein